MMMMDVMMNVVTTIILYSTEEEGILLLDNMAGIRRFHHCHTRNGKKGYGNQRGNIVGAIIIRESVKIIS